MSPDPFIRDAAFRGSPILSYGTANRGSAWPKFLALAAGIFVLLGLTVFAWFWFFTKIPIPKDAVVFTVLPASASLNAKAPLVWKQSQALNSPLPTVAGLAKVKTEQNQQELNIGYAVRLSPATAIIGRTKLWELVSNQKLDINAFQSPYEVFGWPWDMFNGEMRLELAIRRLFSSGDLTWDELPDVLQGVVIGNRWKTTLPVDLQKNVREQTESSDSSSGFIRTDGAAPDVLQNFFRYHGAWADFSNSGELSWKFDPSLVTIDYIGTNDSDLAIVSVDDRGSYITVPFTLEDGEVVQRLYMMPNDATSTVGFASSSSLAILVEQSGVGIDSNFVNDLTCEGEVLARFDHQSLNNFCSWIDICYFDFNNIILLNQDGYLVACGY